MRLLAAISRRLTSRWRRFWVPRAGRRGFGRLAARFAAVGTGPYHGREVLAGMHPNGFVAHTASLLHPKLKLGRYVFIGDRVTSTGGADGGDIELADRVHLYGDTMITSRQGARITIQERTHVQRGCHIIACLADITIGRRCEIAPQCAFYSYDHGMAPGVPIMLQPLQTKGQIVIGDDVWLGHGVVVLSGVRIGAGAVIGAGSVVATDIPDNAIAAGHPARVIKFRGADLTPPVVAAASSQVRARA